MAMPSPLFTKLRHSFLYLTTIIMHQFSGESVGNYVRTFVYKLNVQLNMCLPWQPQAQRTQKYLACMHYIICLVDVIVRRKFQGNPLKIIKVKFL